VKRILFITISIVLHLSCVACQARSNFIIPVDYTGDKIIKDEMFRKKISKT